MRGNNEFLALERQLKKEIRRRTKAEQENDRNKEELRNIQAMVFTLMTSS